MVPSVARRGSFLSDTANRLCNCNCRSRLQKLGTSEFSIKPLANDLKKVASAEVAAACWLLKW